MDLQFEALDWRSGSVGERFLCVARVGTLKPREVCNLKHWIKVLCQLVNDFLVPWLWTLSLLAGAVFQVCELGVQVVRRSQVSHGMFEATVV